MILLRYRTIYFSYREMGVCGCRTSEKASAIIYLEECVENTVVRHRPLGVTIISVVLFISGIFELLLGILILVGIFTLGHEISIHGHATVGSVVDVVGGVLGGILAGASLLIGVFSLIFSIGLWMLKRWAFWLTVVLEVISVVRHLLEFTHPVHNSSSIILGLILPVVILLYFLVDRNVRRAFFG